MTDDEAAIRRDGVEAGGGLRDLGRGARQAPGDMAPVHLVRLGGTHGPVDRLDDERLDVRRSRGRSRQLREEDGGASNLLRQGLGSADDVHTDADDERWAGPGLHPVDQDARELSCARRSGDEQVVRPPQCDPHVETGREGAAEQRRDPERYELGPDRGDRRDRGEVEAALG